MEIRQRITNLSHTLEIDNVKPAVLDETASRVSDFFLERNPIIGNRKSPKTNQPNFAAKHLVGKRELAPYFTSCSKQQNAAAAAIAVVTLLLITKSGRDPDNFQLPIDPQNIPKPELDVNQLLEIRQNSLNK